MHVNDAGIPETSGPPTRFIVLTTQRSGSTWLIELLNSHPFVTAYSELFLASDQSHPTWGAGNLPLWNTWKKEASGSVADYLDRVFARGDGHASEHGRPAAVGGGRQHVRAQAIGFKLMYGQAGAHPDVMAYAAEHSVRLVHLIRRNGLDVLVSRLCAVQRGVFHSTGEQDLPPVRVRIDPESVAATLARYDREIERARRRFSRLGLPYAEFFYEDLCRDAARSVLDFLSVDPQPLRSRLRKINGGPRRNLVANYDEVAAALGSTRFAHFLL